MKLYLFTAISEEYRDDFYRQMRQQNVRVIRLLAVFMVFLVLATYFSEGFIDYPELLQNYSAYRNITVYFLLTSLPGALLFSFLRKKRPYDTLHKYHWLAFLYAALFIGGNIWLSFLSQANPRNAITMLMMSMLLIGAMMVLTLAETLLLIVPCIVIFSAGLAYFQTDPALWIANYFVFCFMITAFFVVSRMLYSYHVNYYIKVKTIEAHTQEIKRANEAKNEILGVVAHDLRSPVSNIQTLVEMMQQYPLTEAEKTEYFSRILECCTKANAIIRDILTAAKHDRIGEMILSEENLNDSLREICMAWEKIINGKRSFRLTLPSSDVYADLNKDKFNRIMDNLISNAIKFTSEDHGSIHIELMRENGTARIMVKDNGIGIPKQQVPYLFDKFTPASRNGLNNEPSVGLGLSISKQLVEKHRGHIYVESEESKGSAFYIDLPAKNR